MMLLCNSISPGAAVTEDDLSDRKERRKLQTPALPPPFLPGRVIRWRCRIMHSPSFLPSSRRLRFQQSVDKTSKLGSGIGLRALLFPSYEHQNLSTGAVANRLDGGEPRANPAPAIREREYVEDIIHASRSSRSSHCFSVTTVVASSLARPRWHVRADDHCLCRRRLRRPSSGCTPLDTLARASSATSDHRTTERIIPLTRTSMLTEMNHQRVHSGHNPFIKAGWDEICDENNTSFQPLVGRSVG